MSIVFLKSNIPYIEVPHIEKLTCVILDPQASVELYVTHTGLMWENARAFGAMMVFAEHRYCHPYGHIRPKFRFYCLYSPYSLVTSVISQKLESAAS